MQDLWSPIPFHITISAHRSTLTLTYTCDWVRKLRECENNLMFSPLIWSTARIIIICFDVTVSRILLPFTSKLECMHIAHWIPCLCRSFATRYRNATMCVLHVFSKAKRFSHRYFCSWSTANMLKIQFNRNLFNAHTSNSEKRCAFCR